MSIFFWLTLLGIFDPARIQGVKDSRIRVKCSRTTKSLKFGKSHTVCLEIYKVTAKFPKEERFGLTAQIRRAAISVPSNIAEGYGRKTTADYIRVLYIAYGSNCELETQVLLAGDLGYIESGIIEEMKDKVLEVERMLKALIKSLQTKHLNP